LPADQAALSTGQVDDATQATGLLDLVYKEAKVQMLASFERTYLKHLLEKSQYNLNQASRLSGINRRHLDDMLLRHHLDKKSLMSRAMAEED
jgi:DNA-binding NtrC family response regulator